MSMPLWFYDLAVYSAQLAILVLAAGLMAWATGLRLPRARLAFWQSVLVVGLLLPAVQPWHAIPAVPISGPALEVAAAPATAPAEAVRALPTPARIPFSPYALVALALAGGVVLRLLWLAAGLVRLRRSRLSARRLGAHEGAEELKSALEVSPGVFVSGRMGSPVTFGWRAPCVILPARFDGMDPVRQRAILCHEFLHVLRRDWRWHIAEEFLRAVFWFHLAVAWLIGQIRLSREQLVDQEAVALTGSRREYLDALLEVAAAKARPDRSPAPLFLRERHLKRRVSLILKEASMSRKRLALALTASFGVLLISGAFAVLLLPLRTSAAAAAPNVKPPLTEAATHFYGNPDAGLTVVEFGDFECRFCGQAEAAAQEAREKLGNQVRFAYRQFPLTKIHPLAEKAAEASECAAEQGKFWPAVNYFYAHQSDLSVPALEKYAAQLGLGQREFDRCLSTGEAAAQVRRDIQDGRAAGVSSVPTFFVGQTKVVGSLSYDRLQSLIEQQLHPGHAAQSPSAADPPAQSGSGAAAESQEPKLDEAALQRQVEQAMKQARIAEQATAKINMEQLRRQLAEAQAQMKSAQQAAKINQAELRKALEQAKLAQQQAQKVNNAEVQRQLKAAEEQAKMAHEEAARVKIREVQRQIKQALEQAKIAQATAARINQAEIQRQVKQAMERAQVAMKQAQEAERKAQEQLKQVKPVPPSAPAAPPAPSVEPAPPSSPQPPAAPSAAPAQPPAPEKR